MISGIMRRLDDDGSNKIEFCEFAKYITPVYPALVREPAEFNVRKKEEFKIEQTALKKATKREKSPSPIRNFREIYDNPSSPERQTFKNCLLKEGIDPDKEFIIDLRKLAVGGS